MAVHTGLISLKLFPKVSCWGEVRGCVLKYNIDIPLVGPTPRPPPPVWYSRRYEGVIFLHHTRVVVVSSLARGKRRVPRERVRYAFYLGRQYFCVAGRIINDKKAAQ